MQYASLLKKDTVFFSVGVTTNLNSPFHAKPMWSRLNEAGVLLDYKVLNDTDAIDYGTFFNTLSTQGDSLVKLFGYYADTLNIFPILWTIRYDGQVIRATVYSDSFSTLIRGDYMSSNKDDNYYLGASYQYSIGAIDAYIIKVNSVDSVLWKKRYGALGRGNSMRRAEYARRR